MDDPELKTIGYVSPKDIVRDENGFWFTQFDVVKEKTAEKTIAIKTNGLWFFFNPMLIVGYTTPHKKLPSIPKLHLIRDNEYGTIFMPNEFYQETIAMIGV